jgi:hypothetical protein
MKFSSHHLGIRSKVVSKREEILIRIEIWMVGEELAEQARCSSGMGKYV